MRLPPTDRLLLALLLVAAPPAGCGSRSAAEPPPGAPPPVAAVPSAVPDLDERGPRLDLYDNRHRFHLRATGRVLPIAATGLWKHAADYSSPWGKVAVVDGHHARPLVRRTATLRVSWPPPDPGAQRLVLRLRGAAGQKVSINLNGANLRHATLDGAWQAIEAPIPAGRLRPGENRILVSLSRPGAALHSVEIVPVDAPPAADLPYPPLDAATGEPAARTLGGCRGLSIPVEVPAASWLRVTTRTLDGEARFRVTARAADGATRALLDERQPAGQARERAIDLAPLGGRLVALDLDVAEGDPARASWASPRLLLPRAPSLPRPAPVDNVVLVVVDALRADRLALTAETRVQTPRLTAAARAGGAAFRRAVAPSPSSPPSHASIQTGQAPRLHGVGGDASRPSPLASPVSALLGRAGVATGYFGNNPFAMERLREISAWTEFRQPNREGKGIDCLAVVDGALAFAAAQAKAGKRFFVSTLPFEPHSPYRYHKGVTERYFPGPFDPALGQTISGETVEKIAYGKLPMTAARWDQLRGTYDGEVDHFDACFGRLLDGLERIGVGRRTAIVLTGDHGEGFGEHHRVGHAYGHWFEVIDVPIVLVAPGLGEGAVIDAPVSGLDVAPTILDLMGLPPGPRMQGASLLPMVLRRGGWPTRVVWSEYGRSFALHSPGHRYIVDYDGSERLYDRARDPAEQAPLGETDALALGYMRDLAGFYLALRPGWRGEPWGSLDNHGPGIADPAD